MLKVADLAKNGNDEHDEHVADDGYDDRGNRTSDRSARSLGIILISDKASELVQGEV